MRMTAFLLWISLWIILPTTDSGIQFAPEDLNDFLALEKNCILPLKGGIAASRLPRIPTPGSPAAPMVGVKDRKGRKSGETSATRRSHNRNERFTNPAQISLEKVPVNTTAGERANLDPAHEAVVAKVTLSDCLSCSGCVTSAEEVLLRQHQTAALLNLTLQPHLMPVVTLSAHACASLAAYFELPLIDTARRVATFLRSLGVRHVLDAGDFSLLALDEVKREFLQRWREKERRMPILCSECPGFVLFVEKTHGQDLLPHLSQIKSPQAIAGSVIKRILAQQLLSKTNGATAIWHCTVMPCHDKKLESAREQLRMPDGSHETDCVLTAGDLQRLILETGVNFTALAGTRLDRLRDLLPVDDNRQLWPHGDIYPHAHSRDSESADACDDVAVAPGGYGGGYLEAVARHAAQELLGLTLPHPLTYRAPRRGTADVRELTVTGPGGAELRFAAVYGYRHIQSLVNDIKSGRCPYHYVEVLSCPAGCTNGGGQVPPAAGARADPEAVALGVGGAHRLLSRVNALYDSASDLQRRPPPPWPLLGRGVGEVGAAGCGEAADADAGGLLRTRFRVRDKSVTEQLHDW